MCHSDTLVCENSYERLWKKCHVFWWDDHPPYKQALLTNGTFTAKNGTVFIYYLPWTEEKHFFNDGECIFHVFHLTHLTLWRGMCCTVKQHDPFASRWVVMPLPNPRTMQQSFVHPYGLAPSAAKKSSCRCHISRRFLKFLLSMHGWTVETGKWLDHSFWSRQ